LGLQKLKACISAQVHLPKDFLKRKRKSMGV
jgi:hypothetical protein